MSSEPIKPNDLVKATWQGETAAEVPAQPMSPGQFGRLWRSRRPLGKDAADEVAAALKELGAAQ